MAQRSGVSRLVSAPTFAEASGDDHRGSEYTIRAIRQISAIRGMSVFDLSASNVFRISVFGFRIWLRPYGRAMFSLWLKFWLRLRRAKESVVSFSRISIEGVRMRRRRPDRQYFCPKSFCQFFSCQKMLAKNGPWFQPPPPVPGFLIKLPSA